MAGNAHRPLTAFPLNGGFQTAYTAPSGTAVAMNILNIATNFMTGTAGTFSALILIGPTASYRTLLPITGITANSRIVISGSHPLHSASWAVVISASAPASALDVYMGGLLMT